MAAPAITYFEDERMKAKCGRGIQMITGKLVFGAYEAGGVSFDLSALLTLKVHQVILDQQGGYTLVYDYTNKKILAYKGAYSEVADAVLVEETAAEDMSTICDDVRFTAIGR